MSLWATGPVGTLPSVVYISVAPSGIVTLTLIEPSNRQLPLLTTGVSRRWLVKVEVALVAPGVALAVHPHSLLPSPFLAQAVRLMAVG